MAASSISQSRSLYLSLLHPLPSPSSSPSPASSQMKWASSISKRNGNGNGNGSEKVRVLRMCVSRREMGITASVLLVGVGIGEAVEVEEYEKETREVISQVRGTIEMEKGDPNTSTAVAALRQASNNWVAKYRRDKQLAGKPSFTNIYSVLNAISGHYISFGPTAPIPLKRKARILEEVDTAEKALSKGR